MNIFSPDKLKAELETLRKLFVGNGFPTGIVQSTISRKLDRANLPIEPVKRTVVLQLPYIGNPSTVYGKRIAFAVEQCYKIVIVAPVFTTRKSADRLKESLPTTSQSNIIYQYKWHCGSGYVGKTTQILNIFHQCFARLQERSINFQTNIRLP